MTLIEQKEKYLKNREELIKEREQILQKLRDVEVSIERFNGAIIGIDEAIKNESENIADKTE